ncbi:MAG TPA: HAD hydrolase-like protein [Streptosporangiaceae bacterium]|nr:HAD hydrolase-like protein [Streptosporangiaceae bacterium]
MSGFLVLWDVDYTLVDASGVGRHLYDLAFAELYGRGLPEAAAEANMAGRTDRAIVLDVLALAGVPDPLADALRFEAALSMLAPSLAGLAAATARALPGAADALGALAALGARAPQPVPAGGGTAGCGTAGRLAAPLVVQSLLTGNVRALAEVKLAPLGLTAHLDLNVGAYGNENAVRSELVYLARSRAAAAYGTEFGGQATVLVGDTPLDVEAALAAGARAVGVATGRFAAAELARAGAHAVLADLSDTGQVVAAVYQPRPA